LLLIKTKHAEYNSTLAGITEVAAINAVNIRVCFPLQIKNCFKLGAV